MSLEAQAFVDNLRGEALAVTSRDNIVQYRQDTRSAYEPRVKRALEKYDVQTEDVNINGTACLQVSSVDWSEDSAVCIFYCYGGGMVAGSPYEDLIITSGLAHYLSARVVAVDYRLAPEHPYPAAQQDVASVYPALLSQYGASRLVISGGWQSGAGFDATNARSKY